MTGRSRENYNRNYIEYVNTFAPPTKHFKNCLSAFGVGFDKEGLAVERVEVQSPAAHWGLRVGDLLQSLGGMRILGRMDLERRVRQLSGTDGEVELSLVRNQSPLILRVPAEALSVPSAVDLGE